MIFRLSTKLAGRLKVIPTGVLPPDRYPLADWSAHIFTVERAALLIVTSTFSLYSVVTHGRGIATATQFASQVLASLRDYLAHDGLATIYDPYLAPAGEDCQFSKALNRSVTGSMNDLIVHARYFLTERALSLHETSARLNDIPFSSLGYRKPREVLVGLEAQCNRGG